MNLHPAEQRFMLNLRALARKTPSLAVYQGDQWVKQASTPAIAQRRTHAMVLFIKDLNKFNQLGFWAIDHFIRAINELHLKVDGSWYYDEAHHIDPKINWGDIVLKLKGLKK